MFQDKSWTLSLTETVNESPYWTNGFYSVWKDPNGIWNYASKYDLVFTSSDKISNCPHQVEKWIPEDSINYEDLQIECVPNL